MEDTMENTVGQVALPTVPTVVRIRRKGDRVVQDCDIYIGRAWTMGGWNLSRSKWARGLTTARAV